MLTVIGVPVDSVEPGAVDRATSPTGEAADMPTAVLVGQGPVAWSQLLGERPVPPTTCCPAA